MKRYDEIYEVLMKQALSDGLTLDDWQMKNRTSFQFTGLLKDDRKKHKTEPINLSLRKDVVRLLNDLSYKLNMSRSLITEIALYKFLSDLTNEVLFIDSVKNTDKK